MKTFWIIFLEDGNGPRQLCFGHNAVADWREFAGYVGYAVVEIDTGALKK